MPKDAPELKVRATQGYGGEVIFYDRYTENREEIGARLAQERGMTLIPPYDHPDVIAGQGTAAKELFDEVGELDVLLVPLGGGGLLAGCALAASKLSPNCTVIGVEPEAGNDGQQSLRSGKIVDIGVPQTIADGAQTSHLGNHNFAVIQRLVSDIVTVSDAQLVETMKFFAERMKMIVEPTGCLAAAAASPCRQEGRRSACRPGRQEGRHPDQRRQRRGGGGWRAGVRVGNPADARRDRRGAFEEQCASVFAQCEQVLRAAGCGLTWCSAPPTSPVSSTGRPLTRPMQRYSACISRPAPWCRCRPCTMVSWSKCNWLPSRVRRRTVGPAA
jgi:hypothetical protein